MKKILLIDDDEEFRSSLESSLEREGHKVISSNTGTAGLKLARSEQPDIILLDPLLPDINGFDLCRSIKSDPDKQSIPIIMLAARWDPDSIVRGFSSGADDYMAKPCDLMELFARIKTRLRIKGFYDAVKKEERESERRYESLIQSLPDIVFKIDKDGRFIFINDFVRNLGYEPDELLGRHFSEIIYHEDLNRVSRSAVLPEFVGRQTKNEEQPKIFDERRTGKRMTRNLEVRILRKKMEETTDVSEEMVGFIYVLGEVAAGGDYSIGKQDEGAFQGTVGIIRDITEKKRSEEKIQLNEKRMEALLKLSQMRDASLDEMADFVLENAIGLTKSKVGFFGLMDENEAVYTLHAWSKETMKECEVAGNPIHFPVEQAGLWGEAIRQRRPIIVNDYSLPSPHKKGMPKGHLKLVRLLTLPLFDEDRIVAVGALGNKETDYDDTDLRQLTLLMDGMWRFVKRKRTEDELRKHEEQLLQADKLKSLGTLVAGVAHEINNPNSFIMFNAPVVRKAWEGAAPILENYCKEHGDFSMKGVPYSKLRETVPRLLNDIMDGSRRMKKIVGKLKDFSRQGVTRETRPVEINSVLKDAVRLLGGLLNKSTKRFHVRYGRGIPRVTGDHQEMEQVIINLITNACQALPDKEKGINIKTSCIKVAGRVVLEVRDEGSGIPKEHLDKIMDPFFTTKRESGGSGLGLSISYGIIKDHGGTIDFDSRSGKGTTVKISLPAIGTDINDKETDADGAIDRS